MTHKPSVAHSKTGTLKLSLKTSADDERPVFLCGNFNNWNPSDEKYKMNANGDGIFTFEFTNSDSLPEIIEYKYTRGNWDNAEINEFGINAENRHIQNDAIFNEDVAHGWMKNGYTYDPAYSPLIEVISQSFEIPQLIKTRRIAALLPWNYHQSDKSYPVLYLQDGQNLFDDYAPFGSWGLDKRLAYMAERDMAEFIVIAIDHAESERIKEFTPSTRTKLGVGEGEKYAKFLAETLKPYIDSNFRTKPEREFTGIGGSSMGGLISIYAAMQHPELYSRLMIFSPSFWVTPDLPRRFIHHTPNFFGKLYLYGGGMEGSNMVFYLSNFKEIIEQDPHKRSIEVFLEINKKGQHSESEWGREFPRAAQWLFNE